MVKKKKTKVKAKPKAKKAVKKAVKKTTSKKAAKKWKKGQLTRAYLALGSNVGDREEFIEQACFILDKTKGIKVFKRSTNYETQAEGLKDQPPFINAAVEIQTFLSPQELLEALHGIEDTLGREREIEWGPRTIDIDILIYDDIVASDDKLTIPHPLLHERLFVLIPLKEIAPKLVHPVLEKTISEIYEEVKIEHGEKYDDELPGFKDVKRGAVVDDYERW